MSENKIAKLEDKIKTLQMELKKSLAAGKRSQTIIKKREQKKQKQEQYKAKQIIKNEQIMADKISADKKDILSKALNKIQMKKYISAKQLGFKYKKANDSVIKLKFKKDNMTREQILKITENIRKIYLENEKNVEFEVALRFEEGWRTGEITSVYEPTEVFDPIQYAAEVAGEDAKYGHVGDQSHFNEFEVFIIDRGQAHGGNSKYNDCLYDCLKKVLRENLPWKTPEEFKTYLRIGRKDKVGIDLIPIIEKKLKDVRIEISGDFTYNSAKTSPKTLKLELVNEHYTILNKGNHEIKKMIHFSEKKPLIYEKSTHKCFDGKNVFELSREKRDVIYNDKQISEYLIVKKEYPNKTFEEEYNNFVETADELKKASNNEINLYKSGSFKLAALNLFDKYSRLVDTEPIGQLESEFISGAGIGALIFAKKYDGPAYKFDVKSFYPSMYGSTQKFPIKCGEFQTITTQDLRNMDFASYGVYRACIQSSEDLNINKLFRFNKRNYYTHIDIKHARELGFDIKMIEDNQSNFLYYAPDKLISGCSLFGEFIDNVFELKQNKVKGAKNVLNFLWGALCERRLSKKYIKESDIVEIEDNYRLKSIKSSIYNDDELIIKTHHNQKMFKFPYARLFPFLLSKSRYLMSTLLRPYIQNCIRMHTDGFTLSEHPKDIQLSDELGGLVYEGYCEQFVVNSCNDFKGFFV